MFLSQKTALITGASSGIGKELARIHAERGGDLVIVARREKALGELKNELEKENSISVKVITKDLSSPNASQEIYDEIKKDGIEIDFLINNAGFGGRGKFHEREWKKDLAMIQVNIIALSNLCRLFLPDFIARNNGKILNVSSTASFLPGPLQAVYFATKSYVQSFSNAIAEEVSGSGITVTNLMPGATETEFARTAKMDKTKLFGKTVSARSVAQDGYQAMLDGKLDIVSGLNFMQKIMITMIPFTPKKVLLRQVRKMQEAL